MSVVVLASAAGVVANGGRSNSGNSSLDDYSYTPSRNGSSSFNDDEVQADIVDTYSLVERSSPEEHMVKGHGQHYHYKDGSGRWRKKTFIRVVVIKTNNKITLSTSWLGGVRESMLIFLH